MTYRRISSTRRSLLIGGITSIAAVACGVAPGAADDSQTLAIGDLFISPQFSDGLRSPAMLVAEVSQTVPFLFTDDIGSPLRHDSTPATVDIEIRRDTTVLSSQTLPIRGAEVIVPHYTATVDVPTAGSYTLVALLPDGELSFPFNVVERSELDLVQVGDPMRPIDTPTTAQHGEADPVCTLLPNPCPFHSQTLTEALATGLPVVYLVATPALCQTTSCGPVTQMLVDRLADRNDIAVVHIEVWKNADTFFQPDGLLDGVVQYGLDHEPSLYAADANGILVTRLDFSWDADELDEAIASIAP